MNKFKIGFWFLITVSIILPLLAIIIVERPPSELEYAMEEHAKLSGREIVPLPKKNDFNATKAHIGKKLWFGDARCETCHTLTNDRPDVCFELPATNCQTCHVAPTRGSGGDGLAQPTNNLYGRNTLSVWNSRFNIGYGWEGREFELSSFIGVHLRDLNISTALKPQEASEVLSEYVKTLVATDSRFDHYLRGETNALSAYEKKGYKVFKERGCSVCHNGVNIGGNSFKIFGTYKLHKLNDPFGWYALIGNTYEDENLRRIDQGMYPLTHRNGDKYRFRVASLRNVEINRPYFTQGQVWELSEAIRTMGRVQLGIDLPEEDVHAIEAFLGTLTGKIPRIQPMSKDLP
ncbi:MAG: c-type cytochrome [Sulfuricurvum sp.]|nr:c-type cytochrome [Sulfuricurvum sp.]